MGEKWPVNRKRLLDAARHAVVEAIWKCKCHQYACPSCERDVAAVMAWGIRDIQFFVPIPRPACKTN